MSSRVHGALPSLICIAERGPGRNVMALVEALPRGACVIIRDYKAADRRDLAREIVRIAKHQGLRVLVAGDWKLAREVRAHGVHLPEKLIGETGRVRRLWRDSFVTAAVHSGPALRRAERAGTDAALLSPVFPTLTHPGASALGVLRAAHLATHARLPVFALGGVTIESVRRLKGANFAGIAAISAFYEEG